MATADLHTHTIYSDGTNTPEELIAMAKQAGLAALAITDHDNLDGLAEGAAAAQAAGLELIPGLEMSAAVKSVDVHLLGFFVDVRCAPFQQLLAEQRARRVKRIEEMVTRVQRLGMAITQEEVREIAGKGAMGRPHVAMALVRRGYVAKFEEAFDRYLSDGKPAYVEGSSLTPKTVIDAIRQANGVPVLAHPIYLRNDALIDAMCADGLAGLEVYHSSHKVQEVKRYERIAKRLGLLKSGGTDYHGSAKEGAPIGAVTVPYELVDALKQWQQQHAVSSSR